MEIPYSDLEIRDMLPKNNNRLLIKGKSAELTFYNVKSDMEIESDYTDFRFRNTVGNIMLHGKSCDIKGEYVEGNLDINTTYTDIDFRSLNSDRITISNTSSSIYIVLSSEPQQIDIRNRYGGVEISVPSTYDGEIDLHSNHGQIKSDFDLNHDKRTSEMSAYSKGKSTKKHIKIENYSSDIILRK